jgi:hypothetical protein
VDTGLPAGSRAVTVLVAPATGPDFVVVLPADPPRPPELAELVVERAPGADDGAEAGGADCVGEDGEAEDVVGDGAEAGADGGAAGGAPKPAGVEVSWVVTELTAPVAALTTDPSGEVVRAGAGRSSRVAA